MEIKFYTIQEWRKNHPNDLNMTETKTKKPILHLNLTKKWFDMIESGKKKEEYRAISIYWCRVFSANIKIKGKYYHTTDVLICFSNGYAKDRKQMYAKIKSLHVGQGEEKWGAEKNVEYFVLRIEKI